MKVSSLSKPDPTWILALEEGGVCGTNIYALYIHKSILEYIPIPIGIGYSWGRGVRDFLMTFYPLYGMNFSYQYNFAIKKSLMNFF